jgi:hypothetical protein
VAITAAMVVVTSSILALSAHYVPDKQPEGTAGQPSLA